MFSPRTLSLFVVLYGTWLLLSGVWEPLQLISGAAASLLVVVIAHRMDVIDGEGHPVQLTWRALLYYPWLFREIVRSNFAVLCLVIHPRMPISPATGWIEAHQKTSAGLVTFANSITLTPGTVALTVHNDSIHVHALVRESLDDLQGGEMDRRVCKMEGAST